MNKSLVKIIAVLLIPAFFLGENAVALSLKKAQGTFKLSAPSRLPGSDNDFSRQAFLELRRNAAFYIINRLIAKYLEEKGSSVSEEGLIEYIEHKLGRNKDSIRISYKNIFKEDKSFCLPYTESGRRNFLVRYFLETETPPSVKPRLHLSQPVKKSKVRYICEPSKEKDIKRFTIKPPENSPTYKHIEIREWKTAEQIEEISGQYGQGKGLTHYLRHPIKRAWSLMANNMAKEIKEEINRFHKDDICFSPNLKGASVMILGPGVNEVMEIIRVFPGIKELHLVAAHKELFDQVESFIEFEFKGTEKPILIGYLTNILSLPEYLDNSIDLLYQQNVFDPGYFSGSQLEKAATGIYKVLRNGGVYAYLPYIETDGREVLTLSGKERQVVIMNRNTLIQTEIKAPLSLGDFVVEEGPFNAGKNVPKQERDLLPLYLEGKISWDKASTGFRRYALRLLAVQLGKDIRGLKAEDFFKELRHFGKRDLSTFIFWADRKYRAMFDLEKIMESMRNDPDLNRDHRTGRSPEPGASAIAVVRQGKNWRQYELTEDQHRIINQVWRGMWGKGYLLGTDHWLVDEIKDILEDEGIEGFEINIHSPPEKGLYKEVYALAEKEKVRMPARSKFRLIAHPGTGSQGGKKKVRSVNLLVPREVLFFIEGLRDSTKNLKAYEEWVEHEIYHIVSKINRSFLEGKTHSIQEKEADVTAQVDIKNFLTVYAREFLGDETAGVVTLGKKKERDLTDKNFLGEKPNKLDIERTYWKPLFKQSRKTAAEEYTRKDEEPVIDLPQGNEAALGKVQTFLNRGKLDQDYGEEIACVVKAEISDLGEMKMEKVDKKVKVCSETRKDRQGSKYVKFELYNTYEDGRRLKISVYENEKEGFTPSNIYFEDNETDTIKSLRSDHAFTGSSLIRLFLKGRDVAGLKGGAVYEGRPESPFKADQGGKIYYPGYGALKVCRKGTLTGKRTRLELVKDPNHGVLVVCSAEKEPDRWQITNIYYQDRISGKVKHLLGAPRVKRILGIGGMDIVSFMRGDPVNVLTKQDGKSRADIIPVETIDSTGRIQLSLDGTVNIKVCPEGEHTGKKARLILVQDETLNIPRLDCYVEGEATPLNHYFRIEEDKGKPALMNLTIAAGENSRKISLEEFYCASFLNGWTKEFRVKESKNIFVSVSDIDARGEISLPFVKGRIKAAAIDKNRIDEKAVIAFVEDEVYGSVLETYAVKKSALKESEKHRLMKETREKETPDNFYFRDTVNGEVLNFRSGELSRHYNIESIQVLDILSALTDPDLSEKQLEAMYKRSRRVVAPAFIKQGKLSFFNLGRIDLGRGNYKKRPELKLISDVNNEPRVLCYLENKVIGYLRRGAEGKVEFVKTDPEEARFLEIQEEKDEIRVPGKPSENKEELLAEYEIPGEIDENFDIVAMEMSRWISPVGKLRTKQRDIEDILLELALNIAEHGGGGIIKIYGGKDGGGKLTSLRITGEDIGPGVKENFNKITASSFTSSSDGRNRGWNSLIFKPDTVEIYTNNKKWSRISGDKKAGEWFDETALEQATSGTKIVLGIQIPLREKTTVYDVFFEKNGFDEFFPANVPDPGYFYKNTGSAQLFIDTVLNGNFDSTSNAGQTTFIVGTDWIRDYNNKSALQYREINRLIVLARQFCEEKGIEFISCPDKDIPGAVAGINTSAVKVAILANSDLLLSKDPEIEKIKYDKNVYLAGVEAHHIEKELSYHRVLEMMGLLLRLAYGQNISAYDNSGIRCYRGRDMANVFFFVPLPEAKLLELDELKERYMAMCDILYNA